MAGRTKGAKTQEQLNAQFEAATIAEKSKISFIQICINEFVTIRYNLPDDLLKDFVKDFSDTLQAKKKTKESIGANWAFELLAKAYEITKQKSAAGKTGMAKRWGAKADPEQLPETWDSESPF